MFFKFLSIDVLNIASSISCKFKYNLNKTFHFNVFYKKNSKIKVLHDLLVWKKKTFGKILKEPIN